MAATGPPGDEGSRAPGKASVGVALVVAFCTAVCFVAGGFTGARAGGGGMESLGSAVLGLMAGAFLGLARVPPGMAPVRRPTGGRPGRGILNVASCGAVGLVMGFFVAIMLSRVVPDPAASPLAPLLLGGLALAGAGGGAALGFRAATRR